MQNKMIETLVAKIIENLENRIALPVISYIDSLQNISQCLATVARINVKAIEGERERERDQGDIHVHGHGAPAHSQLA